MAAQRNADNQTGVIEIQLQLCGHVLRSSYNFPVLYSYCTGNSFFTPDVHGEFGLNDVLPAIHLEKSGFFLSGEW